jgi:hypothetical protein
MLIDRRLVPKISLHQQLPDLGVQFLDLGLAGGLGRLIAAVKQAGHAVHRLPLPRADHRVVHTMLGCQFSQRQIAPDRLHRNLRLEFCTVALSRRLHSSPFLRTCPLPGFLFTSAPSIRSFPDQVLLFR